MKFRKSFTLMELLLATVFLVFSLAASLMLFANCIMLNEYNRSLTIAATHAQYVMEEIRSTSFSDIESYINGGTWDWDSNTIDNLSLGALSGETIDANEIGSDSDLLDVEVIVNWQGRRGRNNSIVIETLITEL